MAIEYILYLTRKVAPVVSPRPLLWASSGPETEPSTTYTEEDYGIRPTFGVLLRPDKWNPVEARAELAAMVGEILRQGDDDALLLQNGELPVLRRTMGRVVVSSRSPWTTPDELACFGLPAEVEDLGAVV